MALTTVKNAGLAGSIDLTAKVTGTLPTGNGGTGSTATTFVNVASNVTGTLPAANGGTGATSYAPGKILQVVSATSNTTYDSSSTAELTTITCDITPSATSSKVLIMFSVPRAENSDPVQDGSKRIIYFLLRDTTKIFTGGADSAFSVTSGGDANHETISGNVIDSPSSTSAITYKVNFTVNTATTNGRWNRANTDNAGTMTMVLMEIDGS